METIRDSFAEWSGAAWVFIGNHLWQSTLFGLLALLCIYLLRHSPARARYAVWVIALTKFALPALLVVLLASQIGFDFSEFLRFGQSRDNARVFVQFTEPIYQTAWQEISSEALPPLHNEIYSLLTILWFGGFLFFSLRWFQQRRAFRTAMRAGSFVTRGKEADALKRVQSWLQIKQEVRLLLSPAIAEPGVWGVFRPVVVLPEMMADHLSDGELEAVLMHELIHITRRDNLISHLQMFLCSVFWFHPLVWLIDKQLLAERETACDEKVVELGGAHGIYAASLLKVLRFCLGLRVAGVSAASGSNLKRRIEKIMNEDSQSKLSVIHRLILGGMIIGVLVFSVAAGVVSQNRAKAQDKAKAPLAEVQILTEELSGLSDSTGVDLSEAPLVADSQERRRINQEITKALEQAPDMPLQYTNAYDAPLTITDAKIRSVPLSGYEFNGNSKQTRAEKMYAARTEIHLLNNTTRPIRGLSLQIKGDSQITWTYSIEDEFIIPAGGSYTWRGRTILGGESNNLIAKVIGVVFDDGEVWGKMMPPPPPPPPPPLPPTPPTAAPSLREAPVTPPAPPSVQGVPAAPAPPATPPLMTARAPLPPTPPAAPPEFPEGVSIRRSGGSMQGSVVNRVQPDYPQEAKDAKVSGAVTVEITVDEEGNVVSAKAISGHPLLRSPSINAVRQWRFKPTILEGKPVKVVGQLTFNFELDDK